MLATSSGASGPASGGCALTSSTIDMQWSLGPSSSWVFSSLLLLYDLRRFFSST
ncbi:hypothetical protein BHE74_00037635 [Ensete ventricosum]|nr:hypothetical protein BHE74_00037635 [Ensete ventricosum]